MAKKKIVDSGSYSATLKAGKLYKNINVQQKMQKKNTTQKAHT